MARSPTAGRTGGGQRPPRTPGGRGPAAPAAPIRGAAREVDPPKPKVSPAQFMREVRAEGRKITWPSRKETWITSVFVGIFVLIAAVFFSVVDGTLSFLLQQALTLVSA
jgi:preprotein translocase subunit SecE